MILYRNPFEQWLWESGWGWWVVAGVYGFMAFVVVAAVAMRVWDAAARRDRAWRDRRRGR